ncbi:MAG: argininosuccinate lyase [Gammaproteobacteria bacterium]|nr:argininosuccinate lyase [Gammaproteobacteria bacterium]|tara:strand:+ start:3059 stop:4459 length:1401 start_codon:yes stop_codon:yes gene_type:complete
MKDKKTNPLWGGRFKEGVNEKASRFSSSVDLDKRLYKEDIDGSIVYAMALKEAKVITQKDYSKIKKGLLSVCKAIEDEKFEWDIALEDVHMNIESALQRKIGEPAKKLHTGRSRNDQVATDLRLFLMRNIDQMLNLITLTQKEIIKLAKRNHDAIMPGFTHTQIAQPVTLGHHLMAWNEMLERDYWRFSDVRKRTSILPLGSSALSGNSYGLDREKMAKRLGFDSVSNNSMDSVSDRDFVVEFLSAASLLGIHLSKINEEIIIWSSSQFGYIELSEEFCTGSSIMPQKKNPDIAELLRGSASRPVSYLVGILSLIKNLPLTYNRDLQEDKHFLFNGVDYCLNSLEVFSLMIQGLKPNLNKMKSDCDKGHITATELADYLVSKGMTFRAAHKKTGEIVANADKENLQLHELTLDALKKRCKLIEEDVFERLIPENALKLRDSKGGTSPKEVLRQIKRTERDLKKRAI